MARVGTFAIPGFVMTLIWIVLIILVIIPACLDRAPERRGPVGPQARALQHANWCELIRAMTPDLGTTRNLDRLGSSEPRANIHAMPHTGVMFACVIMFRRPLGGR